MKPENLFITLALIGLALPLIYMFGVIPLHEHAHASVYEQHNCKNISISYEYFNLSSDYLGVATAECTGEAIEKMEPKHDKIHYYQNIIDKGYMILMFIVTFLIVFYTIPRLISDEES